MTGRARTVFIGSGHLGVDALRRLERHGDVELVGVVTAPPRPAGRGRRLAPTPIDVAATEGAVPTILRPERLRSPEAVASVLALAPDLAVLADYGQLVPSPLLELHHGALNLHPSLLPRHRGASPIPAAILAGDSETGVTLMKMDEGLDTGPIVAQERVELTGRESAAELEEILASRAASLLDDCLGPWLRRALDTRRQPSEGATLTRPLRREHGRLDPQKPAALLERQVRAYQPWPGSFLDTSVGRLIVWRAGVLPTQPDAGPGELVGLEEDRHRLALATVDGLLELLEVQAAGGRRMNAAELLRGRPGVLESHPPAGSQR